MGIMICMGGLPGSGKTGLAKDFCEQHQDFLYFNPDEYYARINGDECIRDNAFEVWHSLFRDVYTAQKSGRSPANIWSVNELFCENCAERFSTCYMCQHKDICLFETDEDPMPKMINKTVSQMGGRMVTTTQVMNPERVEKFCKVCQCNDEVDDQIVCFKRLFGTCKNYKEIDFREKTK